MPRPRSDWSCANCAKKRGLDEFVIHDLPLDCKRCPQCGHARGFKRIFAAQVSTTGHRVARYIDRRLQPQADEHAKRKASATSFEKDHTVAMEKTYELAPPEQREQIAKSPGVMQSLPAAAAFSSIDPAARRDSFNHTWPMVNRNVVPIWENARRA